MTSIQRLSTWYWRPPWRSKSASTPIPTPRAPSVARRATDLMRSSLERGISPMRRAPAAGMNTARVRPHCWKPLLIEALLYEDDEEDGREDDAEQDQQRGVLLHAPGLDVAQHASGLAGADGRPVDEAVDDLLVDPVRAARDVPAGDNADPVDDAVEHVLVEPVRGPGEGAGHRVDNAVEVDPVEGVALLEDR